MMRKSQSTRIMRMVRKPLQSHSENDARLGVPIDIDVIEGTTVNVFTFWRDKLRFTWKKKKKVPLEVRDIAWMQPVVTNMAEFRGRSHIKFTSNGFPASQDVIIEIKPVGGQSYWRFRFDQSYSEINYWAHLGWYIRKKVLCHEKAILNRTRVPHARGLLFCPGPIWMSLPRCW